MVTQVPLPTPRRHRGSRGGGLSRTIGAVAGLVGSAAIAAVVWFNLTHSPVEIDRESLCPKAGPSSTTVVLIDVSDPLPAVAQEDVKAQIAEEVRKTAKFGLLELRLLDPKVDGGQVLFSRCNPGDGSDLSEITANPEQERRKFEDGFEAPLASLLGRMVGADPATSSPIMESVQWIAVKQFAPTGQQKEKPRLIIVSDMIQHSANYSLYGGDASFERYRRSPAYEVLRTDLKDADTTVFLVHRKNSPESADQLLEFWSKWLADNNGSLIRVKKVQGAQ
jgi:hypothetical protein